MSWWKKIFSADGSDAKKRRPTFDDLEPRPIDPDADYLLSLLEQSARSPHSAVAERIGDAAFNGAIKRLIARGQLRLCADLLGRFAMLRPTDLELGEQLAGVLLDVGDLEAADRVLFRMHQNPEQQPRTRMALATLYERRDDRLRAREELELVIAADVEFPGARQRLDSLVALAGNALVTMAGVSSAVSQLGRYRLERELGRGGSGIVYVAYDASLDRRVAVKLLYQSTETGAASDGAPTLRIAAEVELVARLRHPNLIAIYDVDIERGVIVMELCSGGTLANRASLDDKTALTIATEVARTLAYLHDAGVVHGDLKPDNLLFRAGSPRIVLTDFGLARRAESATAAVGGTVGFVAPEVATSGTITLAADIYSFGVLFAWLTDRASLNAAQTAAWRALATRCQANDPAARPTANALLNAIDELR